jgi:hypothetical protein
MSPDAMQDAAANKNLSANFGFISAIVTNGRAGSKLFCALFRSSGDISWQYGEIYRVLAAQGQLIGANDMWIAAIAHVHGMGVVTNNVDEFNRVPGLNVVPY